MSETSKMGLFGSKEDDHKNVENKNQLSKEDSPEHRYAPYSVDSNAEAYDTEALSIMDINDIIGVQTEPVGDSTLEGEMAALSAMITETKNIVTVDDQSIEITDPDNNTSKPIISSDFEQNIQHDKFKNFGSLYNDDNQGNSSSTATGQITTVNKSLLLIGEAYDSDDSQEVEFKDEPKVLSPCKALVDKQTEEIGQNMELVSSISNNTSEKDEQFVTEQQSKASESVQLKDCKSLEDEIKHETSTDQNQSVNRQIIESVMVAEDIVESLSSTPTLTAEAESIALNKANEFLRMKICSNISNEPTVANSYVSANIEHPLEQVVVESMEVEEAHEKKKEYLMTPIESISSEQMETYSPAKQIEKSEKVSIITEDIHFECPSVNEPQKCKEPVAEQKHSVGEKIALSTEKVTEEYPMPEENISQLETTFLIEQSIVCTKDASNPINSDAQKEEELIVIPSLEKEKQTFENNNKHEIPPEAQLEIPLEPEIVAICANQEQVTENLVELVLTPETILEKKDQTVNDSTSPVIAHDDVSELNECSDNLQAEMKNDVNGASNVQDVELSVSEIGDKPSMDITVEKHEKNESICEQLIAQNEKIISDPEKCSEILDATVEFDKFHEKAEKVEESVSNKKMSSDVQKCSEIISETIGFDKLSERVEEIEDSVPSDEKLSESDLFNHNESYEEKSLEFSREKTDENKEAAVVKDDDEIIGSTPVTKPNDRDKNENMENSTSILAEVLNTSTPSTPASPSTELIENLENKLLPESKELIESLGKSLIYPVQNQNTDSLGGLLDLDLAISTVEQSALKEVVPIDEKIITEAILTESNNAVLEKTANVDLLIEPPESSNIDENDELFTQVIEGLEPTQPENINSNAVGVVNTADVAKDLEEEHGDLESKEVVEVKTQEKIDMETIELSADHIERSFNLDQQEKNIPDELLDGLPSDVDVGQLSELESAVKFLQESEEQTIESPLDLPPKLIEGLDEHSSQTFECKNDAEVCELVSELETIVSDSIDISEAEIISEAAKLETEKKLKEEEAHQMVNVEAQPTDIKDEKPKEKPLQIDTEIVSYRGRCILPKASTIPKVSLLEERLKEPPKIEIPIIEPRVCQETPKTSLLIQRDAKINYQKMMDSPKCREDSKLVETSRKEHEKQEIENVGSPRIILKIAKAAIADCGEPRSPKSPKIRSAANSPNPEDSPGQKLGKIRMKLSRGGHPSIISNENIDEQRQNLEQSIGSSALSPLGVKIKLSKTGDASIVQSDKFDIPDTSLGMKIKFCKLGDGSIAQQQDSKEYQKHKHDMQHSPKRTESPIGMKFKLSKTGDASIIQDKLEGESKDQKLKETKPDVLPEVPRRLDSPLGMKIKLSKCGDLSIVPSVLDDELSTQRTDSPIGMKMKISKKSGASIIDSSHQSIDNKEKLELSELPRRVDSPLGMKIKLSKSGDASIIHTEEHYNLDAYRPPSPRIPEGSGLSPLGIGMKIKLSKSGDASIVHQHQIIEKHEEQSLLESRRTESPIGMKIKLSKTGDASIIQPSAILESEGVQKIPFESSNIESMKIKLSKTCHPTIVLSDNNVAHNSKQLFEIDYATEQLNRSEVTLEPIKKLPNIDFSLKRKEVTVSSIELKKTKIETKISQILPEVTLEPLVASKRHIQETSATGISKQQMNVINTEISITQLHTNHNFNVPSKESSDDIEIIEPNPELIIVNENSNSSQDVMIIDEVPSLKMPEVRMPKKRGRPPRKIALLPVPPPESQFPQDPLALDVEVSIAEPKENERPKRTCSRQKSYAPPKRGRGRGGRGKRKADRTEYLAAKKSRIGQDLSIIEAHTTSLINLDEEMATATVIRTTTTTTDRQDDSSTLNADHCIGGLLGAKSDKNQHNKDNKDGKDSTFGAPDRENWLTPSSKKHSDISTIQVIDEDTRMSSESCSRSQTPARTIVAIHAGETVVNEESQGSVVSTATTESEKVKVKNRRMEISFDPDEGPFTVDKIAEYEWPQDRKGETFMIQEQISQYLGVKSFKRKYPDLKRRMVDMEERNYLRENGLVSESMCDMGLTAVYNSEVLDIMCSDFPDQYEEYRKHLREKQIKEHSKKQKELTAAANAEKNRIDLAEMAVQSALSWNVNFNKARRETRRCSLDLQTFTIHVPRKQQKVEENSRVSHYPVALIPGQYTDYYREYTSAELRYYPLNTVVYGPMRPNERKFDSQSEGSQSDSDSDSSSDDSSCSSSEGTQDTEESQSTMDEIDIELSAQKDKSLKCKMCLKHLNKNHKTEILIQCGTCNAYVHPSCIDLTLDMVPHIQAYAWQCTDCKTCAQCHDPADEDKMLFCDMCDRGYHIYCVGLRRVPQGRWHCQECAICASCGSREAGGINADRNSVAQWQHEYKKGDKNTRVYVSTLCVPCSKLWRKGRYCPHCSRCHTAPRLDLEENLVHCSACDKYLHLDCVETKDLIIDRKNYQCDFCAPNRQPFLTRSLKS